jgi:protein involved in polysaccharide export with SLBB domain
MVDPSQYRAPKQETYTLDHGDTLGVFVEGVVGELNEMPPVHQPVAGSSLGPAMGFPTLVVHDGTLRLPLVDPVNVRGLTVSQVESLLKKIYRQGDNPIITDRNRVIVSLIRKRTVNVTVLRGDQSQARTAQRFGQQNRGPVASRSDGSSRIYNLQLPAGESDLLGALMESGGLPGVNAQDQMQILRNASGRSSMARSSFPRSRSSSAFSSQRVAQSAPVRYGSPVSSFPRSNARLGNGDIVSVEAKPTEVFYTGGQLGGGEYLLPRDRPLSVMDAVAQAGGVPQGRRGLAAVPLQEPRLLKLVRTAGGQQTTWQFDLSGGYSQQAAQTRVRAGDYLILDYSPAQRVQNVGIGVLNTYGVRQLFRN